MGYITGYARHQSLMFPEVLDDYVDNDNPVRFIDAYVDQLDMVELEFTHAIPEERGRPPFSPGDLLKLYIYGYLNGIRSSRRLEKATHRNVEVIWLLRKLRPDFKTIADFRKDNIKALKKVCRDFTLLCKKLDLFSCELVGIDGAKFKAVNHNHRNYTKEKLERLQKEIDEKIDAYLQQLDTQDEAESHVSTPTAEELKSKIETLKSRKDKFQKLQTQLQESDEPQISLTDPDSRAMRTGDKGIDVCYNFQIATDEKHKLIVDFEVTNEAVDLNQLANMACKAKETLGVETLEVVADKGYYDGPEVKKCQDENITCYVPKPQRSNNKKSGLFSREEFIYDAQQDCYLCPAKQKLTYRFPMTKSGKEVKVYETDACKTCALRAQCTRSKSNNRRIYRWVHEDIMEEMQQRVSENPEKIQKRKELVEHPFGTIKHWMNHGHFLLRGLEKVSGEGALTVLTYNLKRVINIIGVKELIAAVS